MKHISRAVVIALLTAAVPATLVLAQATEPKADKGLTAETKARLMDGRFAMAKAALKLDDAQMKLWAPVEEQIRTTAETHNKARQERRAKREESGERKRERLALPDRLDRAGERLAKRAEEIKSFAAIFRPFYDSLTEEQKEVIKPVLKQLRAHGHMGRRFGGRGFGHRWRDHG